MGPAVQRHSLSNSGGGGNFSQSSPQATALLYCCRLHCCLKLFMLVWLDHYPIALLIVQVCIRERCGEMRLWEGAINVCELYLYFPCSVLILFSLHVSVGL